MRILTLILLLTSFCCSPLLANDFEKIDAYARNTPDKFTKDVEKLSAYLSKPAKNDVEIARSFYVWLTENIKYDVQAYNSFDPVKLGTIKPNDVLNKRKAVCQGYSELFQELCRLQGIQCELIPGYSKGFTTNGNQPFTYADHAWNAIYIDQKWQLIDATWGSGGINKQMQYVQQFNEKYFLTDPAVFVEDHLPLFPAWQLLSCPVSLQAFTKGPEAIQQEMGKKAACLNYEREIASLNDMSASEKALHVASKAYAFNPSNHQVMARGYIDYANVLMNSIKQQMSSVEEIREAAQTQEEALTYLRKAEGLLGKIKDQSANLEKELVKRNIAISEKNLAGMNQYLKN